MQGPIAIFSDNHRAIDYPNVIYFYEYIQCEDQEATSVYEDACCCLIDYREPGQAVRVANQIRSRFPQMPLLLVTDVSHPFSDQHMVQITGIGRLRLLFWQANDNEEMLSEIQSLLYPEYSVKAGILPSSCLYITRSSVLFMSRSLLNGCKPLSAVILWRALFISLMMAVMMGRMP